MNLFLLLVEILYPGCWSKRQRNLEMMLFTNIFKNACDMQFNLNWKLGRKTKF